MSNTNGIRGGHGHVPVVQNARNQELQSSNTLNSVIKSAAWDLKKASVGQSVPFTITLNKASITKKAIVEIFLNQPNFPVQPVGAPIVLAAYGLVVKGNWYAGNKGCSPQSFYTFNVRIDNQYKTSDELRIVSDAVAAVMRKYSSDGFDR